MEHFDTTCHVVVISVRRSLRVCICHAIYRYRVHLHGAQLGLRILFEGACENNRCMARMASITVKLLSNNDGFQWNNWRIRLTLSQFAPVASGTNATTMEFWL